MPDILVKTNATIADTIALILKRVNHDIHTEFVQHLARELKPQGDKLAYMKRLFDFVCRNVKYQLDKAGKEDVYKPETTITNGKGDCKKMTVIIASVLKAAGIEPLIKHVFYANENFTHVYVIVPFPTLQNYIVLDPVNDCKFNQEVSYSSANIFDLKGNRMDLYTGAKPSGQNYGFMDHVNLLSTELDNDFAKIMGCNCVSGNETQATLNAIFEEAQGTQGIGKFGDKLKKLFNKAADAVKKVGLAPSRGAFLMIVRLNGLKLATKLAQAWAQDPKGIEAFWSGFGGNVDELKKTIIAGSGVQISGYDTIGQGIAAAIATATPILIAVLTKLKSLGLVKPGDTVDSLANDALNTAADAVDSGNVTQDEMQRHAPDNGTSHVIKNMTAVITAPPSSVTREILSNPSAPPSNNPNAPNAPTHGSFFSAFGMCFWGSLQFSQIVHSVQNFPILFFIANVIGTYFAIGFITGIGLIYQANMKWKKYIAWYFDVPKNGFSFTKKIFLNSIHKLKTKYHGA